ncbi:MAG TPA: LTA synthase family protein [Vicinamibacterales bacterium]
MFRWKRYRLAATIFSVELAIAFVLRLTLFAVYREGVPATALPAILGFGLLFDALATLTALLPLIGLLSIGRFRWLSGWPRHVLVTILFFAIVFDGFIQFFFFDEYSARYNHLALDYLMYPDEVFGNILASYNVPLYVGIAAIVAIALVWWTSPRPAADPPRLTWRDRLSGAGVTAGLVLSLWLVWTVMPAAVSPNRVANELALNGWVELVRAYSTASLDYEAYYAQLPAAEASQRVARLIGQPDPSLGLLRRFEPARHHARPLDIVVVMEESLGSEFSTRFGGPDAPDLTPQLDKWSHDGIALTNLIANGNRTVRGLEGVLASFLPLPGDAIVKRNRSDGLATMAQLLTDRGSQSTFVYGGYGVFDNVKPFMLANGFTKFVEQPDFPSSTFRTIWGVADEFVFDEMLRQQREANRAGQPYFGVALTVSNHKPFRWPEGHFDWPADASRRRGAVHYADWAIGHYLAEAKASGLLDRTIVLIVGDHGARVYGAEEIPVASYRIPAVILTPDAADRDTTIERLASQVDLAPTLLSLAGIEFDAPFFGRSLLGLPADGGRAFVNHNRSIGILTDTTMAVLGLHRSTRCYSRPDRSSTAFVEAAATSTLKEIVKDAEAAFQTANLVYRDRQYALPRN